MIGMLRRGHEAILRLFFKKNNRLLSRKVSQFPSPIPLLSSDFLAGLLDQPLHARLQGGAPGRENHSVGLLQLAAIEPGIGGPLGRRWVIRRRDRPDLRRGTAETGREGEDLRG